MQARNGSSASPLPPGAVIFSHGVNAHGEADEKDTQMPESPEQSFIPRISPSGAPPENTAESHGYERTTGQQKQNPWCPAVMSVTGRRRRQRHPEQPHHHAFPTLPEIQKSGVYGHHPNGMAVCRTAVAVQQGDQRVQRG